MQRKLFARLSYPARMAAGIVFHDLTSAIRLVDRKRSVKNRTLCSRILENASADAPAIAGVRKPFMRLPSDV